MSTRVGSQFHIGLRSQRSWVQFPPAAPIKLNKITVDRMSQLESDRLELTCEFPGQKAESIRPPYANFTIVISSDEISGKTLAEIEADAVAVVGRLQRYSARVRLPICAPTITALASVDADIGRVGVSPRLSIGTTAPRFSVPVAFGISRSISPCRRLACRRIEWKGFHLIPSLAVRAHQKRRHMIGPRLRPQLEAAGGD